METEKASSFPSMILKEIAFRLQRDGWDFIVAGGSALAKYKNRVWHGSDYDIFIPHQHPSTGTNLKQTLENDERFVRDTEKYLRQKLNVKHYSGHGVQFILPDKIHTFSVREIGVSKGSVIPEGRVIFRLVFENTDGSKIIEIDFILAYIQNFFLPHSAGPPTSLVRKQLLTNSFVEILDRFDLDVCRVGFMLMINVAQNKKRAIDCMTAILIRFNIYKDVRVSFYAPRKVCFVSNLLQVRRLLCDQIYKQSTKDWELVLEWKFGKTFNKHAALNPAEHYSVMNNFHPRPEGRVLARYNKYTQRGFKIVIYPSCFPLLVAARDELDKINAKKKIKKQRKAEKKRNDASQTKNEVSRLKRERLI